jgi:hypothetical protein
MEMKKLVIGQEPFDIPCGDRFIQFPSSADLFARVGAYPSTDPGQDVVSPDQFEGFLKSTCP